MNELAQTCPHSGTPMNNPASEGVQKKEPLTATTETEQEKSEAQAAAADAERFVAGSKVTETCNIEEQQQTEAPADSPKPHVGAGWGEAANRVFWCVVAFTIASALNVAFDVFAMSSISSDWLLVFTHREQQAEEMSLLFTISMVMKVALAVCFCFYMSALARFERLQPTKNEAGAVSSVRVGVILQFMCFLLSLLLPIMLKASGSPVVVIVLLLYVLLFVVCFAKKGGYKRLSHSEAFSNQTRSGAEDLRFAAVCNINILFTPIVLFTIVTLLLWATFDSAPDLETVIAAFAVTIGKLKGIAIFDSADIGRLDSVAAVILIAFAVAGLLCLIWGICAVAYPIRGWNRIRKASEVEESGAVALPESVTSASVAASADASAATAVSAARKNTAPSQGSAPSSIEKKETIGTLPNDLDDGIPGKDANSRKKFYIAGGVLLAALLTGGYFLFFNADNNPLGIEKPKWEKFVAVTEESTTIYKDADSSSPTLMSLTENSTEEGCNILDVKYRWADEGEIRGYTRREFLQTRNTIMPVISEEKNWYLVHIETWEGIILKGYIAKDDCKEVTPTPITLEVLDKLDEESKGQRCDYFVTKGKYKNLCLTSECYEEEGENGKNLSIGQLTDGVLLYPVHDWVNVDNNGASTIALAKEVDANSYQLSCGDEHLYNPENRQDEWRSMFLALDTHQISDELIDDLVQTLKPSHPDNIKAVYYFPSICEYKELHTFTYSPQEVEYYQTTQSANDEDIHIIGYDVVTKATEYGSEEDFLMANLSNGCAEETGVSFPGGTPISGLTIEDFGDYDGDGDMEVIVQEHCGGSAGEEPPYIVYYDNDIKIYIPTNRFGKWDVVIVEKKEGKVTFVQRYGIHQDRYVYENHRLKQIEDGTMDIGRKLKTWSRNSLYPDDAIDDRIVTFDMDNDGVEEYLTLSHNNSNLYGNGEYIGLDGIRWQNGKQSEYPRVYVSESITILEAMTNGMHDILAGDEYLFRWNGIFYEEWIWNGHNIVKKDNP